MKEYAKYPLPEVVKRWERSELTSEQAIGQMFLHLMDLQKRVEKLERQAPSSTK
jgi:hypothetical protein